MTPDSAFWILATITTLLAMALFWLWRHHPGAVEKAKQDVVAVSAEAEALKSGLSTVLGQLTGVVQDLGAHIKALTPAPQEAPTLTEAVVVPPAGKQGVAGLFTASVTGDPAVDIPALTAAYYKG